MLEMSPESLETHNKPKGAISAALLRLVESEDLGEVYVDGLLLSHVGAGVSTEPDLTFVSWKTLEAGGVRLIPRVARENEFIEIEGAPDIVLEIVSDSSVRKDLELLRAAYARAGIPEYWTVDARGPSIAFQILRLEQGNYVVDAPSDAPQRSVVLDRTFTLTRATNRVGRWRYQLGG